jgi:hypothetical protein
MDAVNLFSAITNILAPFISTLIKELKLRRRVYVEIPNPRRWR